MMKICIIGAGSIGGYLGARLSRAGAEVTLVARGAHLAALRSNGLTLIEADGSPAVYRLGVAERLADVPAQDVVVLGMKAHQLEPVANQVPLLFHADTVVLPMQNGIPWWYFQRHGGPHEGRRVEAVDPRGAIAAAIPAERIIGCVVYPACVIPAPGVVRHVEGDRYPLGELDGSITQRAETLSALFDRICGEARTRSLAAAMMSEAEAVATRLGISFRVTLERRIEGAARVGRHKTSMLQDIEAGRATELEALVGSVIELARLTGTPVPHIEAVYACMRLLESTVCGEVAALEALDDEARLSRVANGAKALCKAFPVYRAS